MLFVLVNQLKPTAITNINVTHVLLVAIFVIVFTAPWELINAWRHHWVYDTRCDLYSDEGWFFNKYLHVGIFIQYPWSGAIMVLFSLNYFGRNVSRETIG